MSVTAGNHAVEVSESSQVEKPIEKLFQAMVKYGASDLHLKVGAVPILRIKGSLQQVRGMEPLTDRQLQKLVYDILSPAQVDAFEGQGSLDLAHEFGTERRRVRLAVFKQRGHISLAARLVQDHIPTFEELHLPPKLRDIASLHRGLVLVCGSTGCGKSTTLAAMIGHINSTRRCHILTIEDPIEFSFKDDKSFINQREIGIDVPSWREALKRALRADPDVMMVGEMRDPDTFEAALAASETGHLVLGTVHSTNAAQTVDRILDMFPRERHRLLRQELAAHLRAIICQMLLPSHREGVDRVPAVEIMLSNPTIRNLIIKEEERKISDVVAGSRAEGMQDMTQALADLVQRDWVLRKVALEFAPNRERLLMTLRGIATETGGIIG